MKKSIFAIICLLTLLISLIPPSSSFAFEQNTAKDINSHWAEKELEMLKSLGIMNGYGGLMMPDSNITRGEFTALIVRAFAIEAKDESQKFSDVQKEHIFFSEINAAHTNGIIGGFPDGRFQPEINITREQIMLILSRLTDDKSTEIAVYKDIGKNYSYIKELSKVSADGIIGGYPDGYFKPYNNTTRAEAAKMIINAMKKYLPAQDNQNDIFQAAHKFIYNYFENIEEAGKLTIGMATKDLAYIENTYNTAKNYGYKLTNTISNINFLTISSDGPFTDLTCDYDVIRTIDDDIKSYKGKSDIRVITRNGESLVYEHNSRILAPQFINLTWEVYTQSTPSYNTKGVTAVSPTCYRISATPEGRSTEIITDSGSVYFNAQLSKSYIEYAKNHSYDIWAMYKSDFTLDTATKLLNDNKARQAAGKLIIKEILDYKLDGINFDFENMYEKDRGAYTNHVREICLAAHTLGAIVSVDVNIYEPLSSTWSMCYDRDSLAKYSDYIMLMAYDQYYPAGKTPGPVAGLPWTESCIKLTLKEVPADKLVLGMPFYVRIWETKNGKKIGTKSISMDNALKQIEENNAKSQYDARYDLIKYSWNKDGKDYVLWLETAMSTRTRVMLAKKYSLAGVASWRRGLESMDVWDAIYEEINMTR